MPPPPATTPTPTANGAGTTPSTRHLAARDAAFVACLLIIGGFYVCMIVAMLLALAIFTTPHDMGAALRHPEIQYAIKLSLVSAGITAIASVWVGTALGYVMSRFDFRGKNLVESLLDIPIVLPPLVIGLALLILFQSPAAVMIERMLMSLEAALAVVLPEAWVPKLRFRVTFAVPSVILAQFMVACAFAVRTMRVTFDQSHPRGEQVAMTLGCSRSQAFWMVALPDARRGMLTAGILAWCRAMGEFGPVLIFASATPMRTEVLPTRVWLEYSIGNIEAAAAVSLLMIIVAMIVLVIARTFGLHKSIL
jgi:molybdate transport system permease protein